MLDDYYLVYSIANVTLKVWKKFENEFWRKFQIASTVDSKINCEVEFVEDGRDLHGIEYYQMDSILHAVSRIGNAIMIINNSWEHAKILPCNNQYYVDVLLVELFYTHAVQRHMLQLHSSLIDHHGHGLMFLGPSGIGKTTQAELWNKYRDALIINGDIVFVQETDDGFLGWGTPWHGSSPYCENTSVPLKP